MIIMAEFQSNSLNQIKKHTLTFINISNSKMILMLSLYTMFIGEPCGKEALDGKEQSGIFNLLVNCRFRKLNNNRENIER